VSINRRVPSHVHHESRGPVVSLHGPKQPYCQQTYSFGGRKGHNCQAREFISQAPLGAAVSRIRQTTSSHPSLCSSAKTTPVQTRKWVCTTWQTSSGFYQT